MLTDQSLALTGSGRAC